MLNKKNAYICNIMKNRLLLLFVCLLCCTVFVQAQDKNDYGIPDSEYSYFQHVYNEENPLHTSTYADTLEMKSKQTGEEIYRLMALELRTSYYFYQKDNSKFTECTDEAKKLAKDLKVFSAYFSLSSNYIVYQLYNAENSLLALQKAKAMVNEAKQYNDQTGLYSSHYVMGMTYQFRDNMWLALQSYDNALQVLLKYFPDRTASIGRIYGLMANCYQMKGYGEKAIEYAKNAIEYMPDNPDNYYVWASGYYLQRDYENFMPIAQKVYDMVDGGQEMDPDLYYSLKIYQNVLEKQYNVALSLCDSLASRDAYRQATQEVYEAMGNYEEAYNIQKKVLAYRDSMAMLLEQADIEEITNQLDNAQLQLEAQRLHERNSTIVYLSLLLISVIIILFIIFYAVARQRSLKKMAALRENEKNALIRTEEALKQAEAANEMKTVFIQNISHEIRTPLNAISGFTQLMADTSLELPDDEKHQIMEQITGNTDQLTQLINNLIELSSLDSKSVKVDKQPINCYDLLNLFVEASAEEGIDAPVNMEIDVPSGYSVVTDADMMRSLVQKLLENAHRFAKGSPIKLGCSLSENPGMLTFSLSDEGPGIPVDKAEEVFNRFKKLDAFKSGFGLGLSICRAIAETLGGKIWLDTSYKKGARFVFTLPVA